MTPEKERRRDRLELGAVRLRAAKVPFDKIASQLGISRSRVNQITSTVKNADIAESGEPRERVIQSYWGE
ncbi:helix-turn-helix domain-containing protein [Paracoccus nototheniae]|uniref:Helix-turn-helix domain-containing protein n=1 Tax=Paracoccus nototheniae TaxID=2489002 RepID=A0ABW4DY50_9RHOB|nr:helix-turn-helix domain-containing protein [Paracoccus nototheniae]